MAGEIEDYVRLQADSLPTGSISFGRFELEPLSWERRSSFSHNRYLEEVEKYSTPGSVTQKKAYFEAHFKKKALEREASSASQDGVDWQTTENDNEDHVDYVDEYLDHGYVGRCQFTWNGETPTVSNKQEHEVMENNGELHFSWYDETSPAMSDEDEYGVIQSDAEQLHFVHYDEAMSVSNKHQQDVNCEPVVNNSPSESPIESIPCNNEKECDYPIELVEHSEVLQGHSRQESIQSNVDDSCRTSELKMENVSVDEDEQREKCGITSKNSIAEKDGASILKKNQKKFCKVQPPVEHKSVKGKLRSPLPNTHNTRNTSTEKSSISSVNTLTKSSGKIERQSMLRIKPEKQSKDNVLQSTSSATKYLKPNASENLKVRARQNIKSGKYLGAKKVDIGSQSISGNSENAAHPSANRDRKNVHSTKVDIKQSNVIFNFKSYERAEKRKEFFMKLEEKLHAKEAEMNEIQAKTQVETEAEIKQFRKSLNFKAIPMPSFYHEALPKDSNGKKMATQGKSSKTRIKSPGLGGRAAPPATLTVNVADIEGLSSSKPVITNHMEYLIASKGDTNNSIKVDGPDKTDEPRDLSRVSQSDKKVGPCKKERGKPLVRQQGERREKKGERGVSSIRRQGLVKGEVSGKASKSYC